MGSATWGWPVRDPPSGPTFSSEPSPEALAYFRNKTSRPSFDWRDVWAEEHANAFTVAKAVQPEVLEAIRKAVDEALAKGVPYEQFAADLAPRLQQLGWWGRQAVVDPETGEEILAELGSPRRMRLIYDANIRSAHAAGQWERAQRTKFALPYLLYIETTSAEPRDQHLAQVGTIAHIDDPYWDTWFPPSGWGCKCSVRQITEAEALARGYKPGSAPPEVATRPWLNKRTGEVEEIPVGIDPGWHRNPGKFRYAMLSELLGGHLDDVDPALRAAALKDLGQSWLVKRIASGEITGSAAAPIGHAGSELAKLHGARSGVVWLTPEMAAIAREVGTSLDDLALVPRLIDEGAVVQQETTKEWLTFYRRIDGQYYRAEIMRRSLDAEGEAIRGGARLHLESLARIDAKTAERELFIARSDRRLMRDEAKDAVDLFDLKPSSAGAAATPPRRPDAAKQAPADGFHHLGDQERQAQIHAWQRLTRPEQEHLRVYSAYHYRQINTYLRTGRITEIRDRKLVTARPEKADLIRRGIETVSRSAQASIHDNMLPDGVVLYRGQSLATIGKDLLTEGYEWRDPAFTSTTRELKQALPFLDHAADAGKEAVVMIIDAGGKRGLALEGMAEFAYEREVVLPAGTAFRVRKVEAGVKRNLLDRPRTYVHVDIIDQPRDLAPPPAVPERNRRRRPCKPRAAHDMKGSRRAR